MFVCVCACVCEYDCNSYISIHVSIYTAPAVDTKKTAASTSAAARAAAGVADDVSEAAADFLSKDVDMMKAGELKAGVNVCVYVCERREAGVAERGSEKRQFHLLSAVTTDAEIYTHM